MSGLTQYSGFILNLHYVWLVYCFLSNNFDCYLTSCSFVSAKHYCYWFAVLDRFRVYLILVKLAVVPLLLEQLNVPSLSWNVWLEVQWPHRVLWEHQYNRVVSLCCLLVRIYWAELDVCCFDVVWVAYFEFNWHTRVSRKVDKVSFETDAELFEAQVRCFQEANRLLLLSFRC